MRIISMEEEELAGGPPCRVQHPSGTQKRAVARSNSRPTKTPTENLFQELKPAELGSYCTDTVLYFTNCRDIFVL